MARPDYRRLYGTKRWFQLRARQLREQPLCKFCGDLGRITPAAVVDHKRPHRGDEALFFDPDNLQSLCKPCHDGAKQQLEKSGTLRGCGLDGVPLDASHHWRRAGG